MKSILCIIILMFLSGCNLSQEIGKNTVLREVRVLGESPIFLETEEAKTEETIETAPIEQIPEEEEFGEEEEDVVEYEEEFNEFGDDTISEETEVANQEEFKEPYANLKKTTDEFTDELKAEMMRAQQNLYGYSNLEITQQNLYVEILFALENYIEEMEVSSKDTAEIDKVFQYVLIDHPEIFYADGYSFIKYTVGEELQKITFKGTYVYDWEEKEILQAEIQTAALELLKNLPSTATDYEKVKYVYETIINQTEYSLEAKDNQNICSVFLGQASVCQGYAKAVQYLLEMLQIPTTLVMGTVETGEAHAWNMVKINNNHYFVDATWGDASYRELSQEENESKSTTTINYDYLCVTTKDISRTHSVGDILPVPICDSMEANYYVLEGAYFTQVDYEKVRLLIEKYREEGRESVTLKCADEKVYKELSYGLLQEQKIFQYLESKNNSIVYTDSEKQRSLTFWL